MGRGRLPPVRAAPLIRSERRSFRERYSLDGRDRRPLGRETMLWTIAVILLVLWLLGFFAFHVAGGLIHILLVLAIIVGLIQLFTGRRTI
jgi:hypothetical protein